MKLNVKTRHLKNALDKIASIPGARGSCPSSGAVMLDADEFGGLFLTRITPEASIRVSCEAEIEEGDRIAVAFDSFAAQIGRFAAHDIAISSDKKGIIAKAGRSQSVFSIWPEDDIAEDHPDRTGTEITVAAEELNDWISSVERAAHTDQAFPALRGVCVRRVLGKLAVFSVDKRRLHICFGSVMDEFVLEGMTEAGDLTGNDAGVMLTRDTLSMIHKILSDSEGEITMKIARNGVQIEGDGVTVKLSIPVDVPPNIEPMLPLEVKDGAAEVNREELLRIVSTAQPLGNGTSCEVVMLMKKGEVVINADNGKGATFSEAMDAETSITGEYRFNANYMIDMLNAAKGETVEIRYVRSLGALCIREFDRFLLLMLLRTGYQLP